MITAMARHYGIAGVEPPLWEVLRDPVIESIMRRDGVTRDDLESLIADLQVRQGMWVYPPKGRGSFLDPYQSAEGAFQRDLTTLTAKGWGPSRSATG